MAWLTPLVAVLALVLPATAPAAGAQRAEDRLAAVQAVLDARAEALRAGNREAWLATVDPEAPAPFRQAQSRLFDGLRSVPIASYRLEVRTGESGDLAHVVEERYRPAPVFLPETRQRLRLRDYDATDQVDSLWLTFVQRDGRWFVGADRDLEHLGLDTARGVWDGGPVTARPTARFLVLSHPEQEARAGALAGVAEEAATVLAQRWDQPWPGRIPLVLPGSVEELEAILQATIDLDKFVAFVSYGSLRDAGWDATAPRIYIQDRNLSRYGRAFQVETLVHELKHAAAATLAGPFVPAWVHEGVADWVAEGQPTGERRPSGAGPTLPRDFEFTVGSQADVIRSYASARSAIATLAKAKGRAAPSAFLKALGEVRVAPGSVDYQVDAALRRTAGIGVADLEQLWRG